MHTHREKHQNALKRGSHPELPLPAEPVVTPAGKIKWVQYSARCGGTLVEVRRGMVVLAEEARMKGYALLSQLFEDEGWPDGMAAYREYMDASDRGMKVDEYPARLLPREVLRRRAGTSEAGRKEYKPREVQRPDGEDVEAEIQAVEAKRAADAAAKQAKTSGGKGKGRGKGSRGA